MAVKIQLRRDTAGAWASVNPVLSEGEIGIETGNNFIKVGDGSTPWNDLVYANQRWLTIALSDNITPVAPGNDIEFYEVRQDLAILGAWFSTPAQAPSGSDAVVNVRANGALLFSATVNAGETTSEDVITSPILVPGGTLLTFDSVQVGAVNTGLGYRVTFKVVGG